MNYIHRKHTLVTTEIEATMFTDTNHEYSNTFVFSGVEFDVGNVNYYDRLKPLLIHGPAWTFICPFDKRSDGRGEIRILIYQAERESSKKIRMSAAYHEISAAHYRGTHQKFHP